MAETFLRQAEEGNKNALLKRQILGLYITAGDFSITDLSKEMNLSVPTTTKLIGELITEGYVHDYGKQGRSGGRRPKIYGLNPYAGYFVGVDIIQDSVNLGIINFKGQMVFYKAAVHFKIDNTIQSLDRLCTIVKNFISESKLTKKKILAVGVNLSGRVNSETGYCYNYYFEERPLSVLLEERLGYPVHLENDTRAMQINPLPLTAIKLTFSGVAHRAAHIKSPSFSLSGSSVTTISFPALKSSSASSTLANLFLSISLIYI